MNFNNIVVGHETTFKRNACISKTYLNVSSSFSLTELRKCYFKTKLDLKRIW